MSISRTELVVALLVTLAGFGLRFERLGLLAVEHFDEGVYASNLLFPDDGYQYPNRFLYGPPLLPSLVEWTTLAVGTDGRDANWIPFLPSLLLGSLTVPLVWWAGRNWFGPAAGVAAASLVALSDFHITMSRSVLTDAPLLFFLLLAVWLIVESLSWLDLRLALAGGLVTGLAWATKYNGWLPLAIALSGTVAALIAGRKQLGAATVRPRDVVPLLLAVVVGAVALWSPVWFDLQDVGGYARVAENHRQFVVGPGGWLESAIRHEAVQRHDAGWPTLLSAWLAALAAGLVARADRFTGNAPSGSALRAESPGQSDATQSRTTETESLFRARSSNRFTGNAQASAPPIDSHENSPIGFTWNEPAFHTAVLKTAALAGAIVLSPLIVLLIWSLTEFGSRILEQRRRLAAAAIRRRVRQSAGRGAHDAGRAQVRVRANAATEEVIADDDAQVSLQWKQWFGVWLSLAWLCGLILATPLYRPYPRLLLPLLGVSWLGTGAAVARLIVTFCSARDRVADSTTARSTGRAAPRFVWLIPVALLCLWRVSLSEARTWQDRTELAAVAPRLLADARLNSAGEKSPEPELDFVVYVYGEPGLLNHLPADRVAVRAVSDLGFARPGSAHPHLPTYLATGPHAGQSRRFAEQFFELENRFELVAVYPYRPSDFVLLDDVAPRDLDDHRAAAIRVFRVKFDK